MQTERTAAMGDRADRIIVYLAYQKTGSKWLWNRYFKPHLSCHQVNVFRNSPESVRETVGPGSAERPVVARHPVTLGLMGEDIPGLARRLEDVFPGAKIVLAIRSQRSMLPSHYGQYAKQGGRLGFHDHIRQVAGKKWHYYTLISELHEAFGAENVFVGLFEDFREDQFAFLKRLQAFIGDYQGAPDEAALRRLATAPRMNPQRNDLVVDTMLLLNRLRLRHPKNAFFPVIRRPGHDHILVELAEVVARSYAACFGRPLRYRKFDDRGALGRAYGAENEALSALLRRPLRDYGYPD